MGMWLALGCFLGRSAWISCFMHMQTHALEGTSLFAVYCSFFSFKSFNHPVEIQHCYVPKETKIMTNKKLNWVTFKHLTEWNIFFYLLNTFYDHKICFQWFIDKKKKYIITILRGCFLLGYEDFLFVFNI